MNGEKTTLKIEANVRDAGAAKELLDDLETLLGKYDVTIDLKISQGLQAYYTLT